MKLLFVFTGGTIGSKVNDNYIKTDESAPYELIEAYSRKHGLPHSYDIITPYTKLSENNTGKTITNLVKCVADAIGAGNNKNSSPGKAQANSYDGVIVTHGTDTLPYSAAALDYALGQDCVPVCVVSANYPINDKRSNALANLRGAIKLIEEHSLRGVFVPYTNHDGITYIHRPTKLLETLTCSDEYFSINNECFGHIKDDRLCINDTFKNLNILQVDNVSLNDECNDITRIKFYPGLKLPAVCEDTKCVLIEGYHSGTINTEYPGYRSFFDEMKKRNIPIFLAGVNKGISYESTSVYDELGISPIYGVSPVAVYMKLWILATQEKHITTEKVQGFFGG